MNYSCVLNLCPRWSCDVSIKEQRKWTWNDSRDDS